MHNAAHRAKLFLIGIVIIMAIGIFVAIGGGMMADNIVNRIEHSQESHYDKLIQKLDK